MHTDYAQTLPIMAPVAKAGGTASVGLAGVNGKGDDQGSNTADSGLVDVPQGLTAFDQTLAQVMRVQAPAPSAQAAPQAPSQQSLAPNSADISVALLALKLTTGPAPTVDGTDAVAQTSPLRVMANPKADVLEGSANKGLPPQAGSSDNSKMGVGKATKDNRETSADIISSPLPVEGRVTLPSLEQSPPIIVAIADGKKAEQSQTGTGDPEALAAQDNDSDLSQTLSASNRALAQMMMLQVQTPIAAPIPQERPREDPAAHAIDMTTALKASSNRVGYEPPLMIDPGSALDVPMIAAESLGAATSDQTLLPSDQNTPAKAAIFAGPAPAMVGEGANATPTLPISKPAAQVTGPTSPIAGQNRSKSIDLATGSSQASPSRRQLVIPQRAEASIASEDAAVATLGQPTAIIPSSASILRAMGNAISDPTARVIGTADPQPVPASGQTGVTARTEAFGVQSPVASKDTAPDLDRAPTVQSAAVQAPLVATAQPAPQALSAATQALVGANANVRETAQTSSQTSSMPVVSTEGIQTSGIATSLTVIATSTNGGFSKTDQDAKPKDAPADPSENAAPQTLENDSEASTDIFGTALPLEGKVSQGGLQQISSPTLSTSGTAPHLAAEISRKFEGKSAQFDISLTPEGLGKVDVKITINARGEVSAAMKFDNPQAAAELKGRAAELQQALEQSGFSISRDGISFTDQQGRGFGAPQQQANQQDWQEAARRTAKSRVFQDISDLAEASALKVAEASSAYSRRSSTGVDVRI